MALSLAGLLASCACGISGGAGVYVWGIVEVSIGKESIGSAVFVPDDSVVWGGGFLTVVLLSVDDLGADLGRRYGRSANSTGIKLSMKLLDTFSVLIDTGLMGLMVAPFLSGLVGFLELIKYDVVLSFIFGKVLFFVLEWLRGSNWVLMGEWASRGMLCDKNSAL